MSETHSTENWRTIPDFPGYEVSDQGRVRSCWKRKGHHGVVMGESWRILKPHPIPKGYLVVGLYRETRRIKWFIHHLVLTVFVGPPPVGTEGCHGNGCYTDNRLVNLRWDTHQNNILEAYRQHGGKVGSRRRSAKLTEKQVQEIRRRVANGEKQKVIAAELGVSRTIVCLANSGKTWKHVQ